MYSCKLRMADLRIKPDDFKYWKTRKTSRKKNAKKLLQIYVVFCSKEKIT